MSTLYTPFTPLVEVTSNFLNTMQRGIWTQRGSGAQNTMVATIDTPSSLITVRTVVFAMDTSNWSPPLFGGIVDNTMDWRDRQLFIEAEWEMDAADVRDIRWGEADDAKQALNKVISSAYSRTGGVFLSISPKADVAVYVDSTNGYLWMKKAPGFSLRGKIAATVQLRERS